MLTVVLTVLLVYIFRSTYTRSDSPFKFIPVKIIVTAHSIILGGFVILTASTVIFQTRPFAYFASISALFLASLLVLLNSENQRLKNFISVSTISIITLSTTLSTLMGNGMLTPGQDQGRDNYLASNIINAGKIDPDVFSMRGYYSVAPMLPMLNSIIQLIVKLVSPAEALSPLVSVFLTGGPYVILTPAIGIVIILGIYALLKDLTKDEVSALTGCFVFLSTPILSFVNVIPTRLSLALVIWYMLLVIKLIRIRRRETFVAIIPLCLAFIFTHPVGVLTIFSLLTPLLLFLLVNPNNNMKKEQNHMYKILLFTLSLTLTYWMFNETLFSAVIVPGKMFLHSFSRTVTEYLSWRESEISYIPQYYAEGFQIFAYAWMIPFSLSAAYFAALILTKRKNIFTLKLQEKLLIVAAAVGCLMVFVSFIASKHSTLMDYISSSAYLILTLPAACAASAVIKSARRSSICLMLLLLTSFIAIGTYSPNWALYEHPDFGVIALSESSVLEGNFVSLHLTSGTTTLYFDYDITPLRHPDVVVFKPDSYKVMRSVINDVTSGAQPKLFARSNLTLFQIKTERIGNKTAISQLNIIHSTGYHMTLAYQREKT